MNIDPVLVNRCVILLVLGIFGIVTAHMLHHSRK